MGKLLVVCAVVAGCATSDADPKAGDAAVTLSAVTLSDDCLPPPPPSMPASVKPQPTQGSSSKPPATPSVVAPSDCPAPNCGRHCDQTSMQLGIKATAATTITIKKVELLDDKGKFLEELRSFRPKQWSAAAAKYVDWDGKATGELKVMYDLTTPNWSKLTGSRWNAHNKKFQVRVTVGVGTATKTVDKQSITPVMLPPPAPT